MSFKRAGNVSDEDMARTFNLGLGFCIVVDHETAEKLENGQPENSWLKVQPLSRPAKEE